MSKDPKIKFYNDSTSVMIGGDMYSSSGVIRKGRTSRNISLMQHRGPFYPNNNAEFLERTGISADSIYPFTETTGDVSDIVGVNHLITVGVPTYQVLLSDGMKGITYSPSSAHRKSLIHLPGTESAVYGTKWAMTSVAAATVVVGLSNGSVAPCMVIGSNSDGSVVFRISDGTSALQVFDYSFISAVGTNKVLYSMIQCDRAAGVMRGLLTDGESYSLVEGSIAGFATLNLGGQTWGVGVRGWTGGNTNGYTFARKGVEAEGSHLLEQIARGLGWIA